MRLQIRPWLSFRLPARCCAEQPETRTHAGEHDRKAHRRMRSGDVHRPMTDVTYRITTEPWVGGCEISRSNYVCKSASRNASNAGLDEFGLTRS